MTAIGSKKPPLSRKSIAGQLLFAVALLIIARTLWTRTQPERLAPPLVGYSYQIIGDNLYGINASKIQVQPIHETKPHTLVPEDPNYPFYAQSTNQELSIAEGDLYYAVKARSKSPSLPTTAPFYPTFLLPPQNLLNTPIAGQKRTNRTQYPASGEEVRIRQIPLQGGAPRDVASFHSDNLCLVGNHVFWIRSEAEESDMLIQTQTWTEATAHSDLMFTSLLDGTTRCIRHSLYHYTGLRRQASGITWAELSPYPKQPTLFYANASDGIPHALSLLEHQRSYPIGLDLVEVGGRLYWNSNQMLMSSQRDGTDIREVLKPSEKYLVTYLSPFSYRDSLYFYMQGARRNPKDSPSMYLCRLHSDRPDPTEIVRTLPNDIFNASDGYLYFERQEHHRPAWDTLTGDDAHEISQFVLCRIPMQP